MHKKIINNLKYYDWWLLASVLILVIFGILIIYSVGINSETSSLNRFYKQIIFAIIGLIIMILFSFLDYRLLNNYSYIIYVIGILILIAVLVFGTTIKGTTGWFSLGFFSFQPVELAKVFLVILLARFFSLKGFSMNQTNNILISIGLAGAYIFLVFRQPDLGSALIFLGLWLGLLLLSNVNKKQIVVLFFIFIISCLLAWSFFLKDYQKDRILTFLNPSRDPFVSGYNVIQSTIAVGSGQFLGRGLGLGPQSQLNFLPEQEADFIFAVISEELGFIGGFLIIFLYTFIFYRIWLLGKKARDDFTLYLVNGILIIIFVQTIINIGMNIGLMPVTGLPLPWVSAGGSSLVINLLLIGILQNIYKRQLFDTGR